MDNILLCSDEELNKLFPNGFVSVLGFFLGLDLVDRKRFSDFMREQLESKNLSDRAIAVFETTVYKKLENIISEDKAKEIIASELRDDAKSKIKNYLKGKDALTRLFDAAADKLGKKEKYKLYCDDLERNEICSEKVSIFDKKTFKDANFIKTWYEFGLKHKSNGDFLSAFVAYWIAFEFLIVKYNENDMTIFNNLADQIDYFCQNEIDELKKLELLNDGATQIFLKERVKSKRKEKQSKENYNVLTDDCYSLVDKYSALFKTFFIVRCNLVHGIKTSYEDRDVSLIKSVTFLLDKLFDMFLKNGKIKKIGHTDFY